METKFSPPVLVVFKGHWCVSWEGSGGCDMDRRTVPVTGSASFLASLCLLMVFERLQDAYEQSIFGVLKND